MDRVPYEIVQALMTAGLDLAQAAFKKNPSADNWNRAVRAMLAYQQAAAAAPAKREQLETELFGVSIGDIDAVLVKSITGRYLTDLISAHA